MRNPIEVFHSAKKRVNPEGLAFGAAVATSSLIVLPAVSSGVTLFTHEFAKQTDPNLTKAVAVGIIAILSTISTVVEAKTLESNGYCASPVSSTFYVLTGKPLSSSIAGHAVNFVEATVANPLNIFSAVTNNRELLIENELSSLMVLGGWLTALNTLILQGKTRPFVDGVKKMRQSAVEKLKRKEKIESTIAVDK